MSEATIEPEMVLPEACPKCGKPLRFLFRAGASDDDGQVRERMSVQRNPHYQPGDEDAYPYDSYFVTEDFPQWEVTFDGYTFECTECGHPLPDVDSTWFTLGEIPPLTIHERDLLMQIMDRQWGDDGPPPEDADLVKIYWTLHRMNQVSNGEPVTFGEEDEVLAQLGANGR